MDGQTDATKRIIYPASQLMYTFDCVVNRNNSSMKMLVMNLHIGCHRGYFTTEITLHVTCIKHGIWKCTFYIFTDDEDLLDDHDVRPLSTDDYTPILKHQEEQAQLSQQFAQQSKFMFVIAVLVIAYCAKINMKSL